jgi:hypothetical protein
MAQEEGGGVPDSRTTRKTAERAAKEALERSMVAVIGDLSVAAADVVDQRAQLDQVAEQGRSIVADARRRASALVDQAQSRMAATQEAYADKWLVARSSGWGVKQLQDLGYRTPTKSRRDRDGAGHHMQDSVES